MSEDAKEKEKNEDSDEELDLDEEKEEVPSGMLSRVFAVLKQAKNENLVTILSIGILLFSAITGILAQELNEVDREASAYETSSSEYVSQARTLESIENQVILREEILLTEVKHLVLEQSLYQAEVELLNESMEQNTQEYHSALLIKDLISYQQNGIMLDDGLLVMCEENPACAQETVSSENVSFDFESFTFIENMNTSTDIFLSVATDVVNDNENIFGNGSLGELEYLEYRIGYYHDVENKEHTFNFLGKSGGIEGYLTQLSIEYDNLSWDLLTEEAELDSYAANEQAHLMNWIYYSDRANHFRELWFEYGDSSDYQYFQIAWENATSSLSEANAYSDLIDIKSDQITFTKAMMLLRTADIQELQQADLSSELNAASDKFNLMSSEYQRYIESYQSAQTGLENALDLTERLLEQSIANQSGYIQSNSGEFISEDAQNEFIENVHNESAEKYELSKTAVQEAEDIRSIASDVSSSVMYVSVGNVTLGIAGGMLSRSSFGLKNARSIYFLVAAGMAVGMVGLVNALMIVF